MQPNIAVIGAGVSGLSCAKALKSYGFNVTVFEKSRGAGGRAPTRWLDRDSSPAVGIDHGTQYFHADSPEFRSLVLDAQHQGAVAPWMGQVVNLGYGQVSEHSTDSARWVGTPGMASFGKFLAQNILLNVQSRAAELRRENERWVVALESPDGPPADHPDRFDWLVVAVPAEQAAVLLTDVSDEVQKKAASVHCTMTWSVMLTFESRLALDYDGAFVVDSPLGWICRDSSKPGRAPGERWILHATADWSRAHEQDPAEAVADMLIDVFQNVTGVYSEPVVAKAHRWLYSLPSNPLGQEYLLEQANKLGVCGDWVSEGSIESAYLSGLRLAESMKEAIG